MKLDASAEILLFSLASCAAFVVVVVFFFFDKANQTLRWITFGLNKLIETLHWLWFFFFLQIKRTSSLVLALALLK